MTGPIEISIRAVSAVDTGFLVYADASGRMYRIDLSACAERFAKAHSTGASARCVGERHIDGRENYLMLYAEPLLRIACAPGFLRRRKDTALLRDLLRKLNASGWRTMDMT